MIIIKELRQTYKTYFTIILFLILMVLISIKGFRTQPTDSNFSHKDVFSGFVYFYSFIICIFSWYLVGKFVRDEFVKETFPFLLTKPVSMSKLFSIKYILGALQSVSFSLVSFLVLYIKLPFIFQNINKSDAISIISRALLFVLSLFSMAFFAQLLGEKRRPFWAIIFILMVWAFNGFSANIFEKIFWVMGIISLILSFLALHYPSIKEPLNRISKVIFAFAIGFIALAIIGGLYLKLNIGKLPTLIISAIFTPLLVPWLKGGINLYVFKMSFFSSAFKELTMFYNFALGIFAGLAYAGYIYWDSCKRVNKKIYSILDALIGFLFGPVGLVCYFFSRNKGVFKNCSSCGKKKLNYIYPCQYCGYHFDKEFRKEKAYAK